MQKTAYEMRISDWSSDVCSSDLLTYEKDGALWMRTEAFGDEKDRVLVKADGAATYFCNDLAYHVDKLDRGWPVLMDVRSDEHTSELQSLMRRSYAVFCLKKKKIYKINNM